MVGDKKQNEAYKHLTKIEPRCIILNIMKDINVLERIGQTIRTHRLEKGWSQEKLAEASRIDRSFLGKVERGVVNVSVLTLCDITKALGIKLNTLFDI